MRLIDADELIERIGKWIQQVPCGREQTIEEVVVTNIAVSVCMEIEETQTAYDNEKVIEQLKEEGCIVDDEAGNRAVEIIENGGLN